MNKGYIKLHRKIKDHWIFRKPDYFRAWIDIILTVNYQDGKTIIGQQIIVCKRGESVLSIKSWATRWRWSYSKVRNFFKLLEKDNMIQLSNKKITTRLTIINYDSYQDIIIATKSQTNREQIPNKSQTKTIKERKKKKKNIYSTEFERFWTEYPRKISKDSAFKRWKINNPNIEIVIKSIRKHKQTEQWKDIKYIPHPTTWLNQKRWNDEIDINEIKPPDLINQTTPPEFTSLKQEKPLSEKEEKEIEAEKKQIVNYFNEMKKGMN